MARYLERMEQAQVDILNNQKPVNQVIILWWGLDGLRLNENGELEWIRRGREKHPLSQTADSTFLFHTGDGADSRMSGFLSQYPTYKDFLDALSVGSFPIGMPIRPSKLIEPYTQCRIQMIESVMDQRPQNALMSQELNEQIGAVRQSIIGFENATSVLYADNRPVEWM